MGSTLYKDEDEVEQQALDDSVFGQVEFPVAEVPHGDGFCESFSSDEVCRMCHGGLSFRRKSI